MLLAECLPLPAEHLLASLALQTINLSVELATISHVSALPVGGVGWVGCCSSTAGVPSASGALAHIRCWSDRPQLHASIQPPPPLCSPFLVQLLEHPVSARRIAAFHSAMAALFKLGIIPQAFPPGGQQVCAVAQHVPGGVIGDDGMAVRGLPETGRHATPAPGQTAW